MLVVSGKALAAGGPAALLATAFLMGLMVYSALSALCEMTVMDSVAGSFVTYSSQFIDPAWGFALGWIYALQWFAVLPLEIVATSVAVRVWVASINRGLEVGVYLSILLFFMLLNAERYIEIVCFQSIIKLLAVLGFRYPIKFTVHCLSSANLSQSLWFNTYLWWSTWATFRGWQILV